MWHIDFFLKLQGADNGSESVNPAESWNFFRKRGGKTNKGKKEKHNKESSKVLGVPLSKPLSCDFVDSLKSFRKLLDGFDLFSHATKIILNVNHI